MNEYIKKMGRPIVHSTSPSSSQGDQGKPTAYELIESVLSLVPSDMRAAARRDIRTAIRSTNEELARALQDAILSLEYANNLKYPNGNPVNGWGVRQAAIDKARAALNKAKG